MSTPLFRFGAFTDLHLSSDNRCSGELITLQRCAEILNRNALDFVIQLGDIIACSKVDMKGLRRTLAGLHVLPYNVLGNHDFDLAPNERNSFLNALFPQGTYYDFSPSSGWRCIILDGTEISLFRYPEDSVRHKEATTLINELKAQKAGRAFEWNGALSSKQLKWLAEKLSASDVSGENVLIFCHFPCFPSDELFSLLNASDVIDAIDSCHCVRAYISGHQHPGFYEIRKGVHYLSLISVDANKTPSCAIIEIHSQEIRVKGKNGQESMILPL